MMEIRWHGRGGQGAKSMSQVLAEAWLKGGEYVQAFPEYGPERSGAPVTAYTRADTRPIRIHHAIRTPDVAVVIDPSLLGEVPLTAGLKPEGVLLVNTEESADELANRLGIGQRVLTIPGDRLAREVGGRFANVVMLGAVARALGEPPLEALEAVVRENKVKLPPEALEANVRSVRAGYDYEPQEARGTPKVQAPTTLAPISTGLPGGVVLAETAPHPRTGSWRTGLKPAVNLEACINCLLCWVYCPDDAIRTDGQAFGGFDYQHCKGCELCVGACPTQAIAMIPENVPITAFGRIGGKHA